MMEEKTKGKRQKAKGKRQKAKGKRMQLVEGRGDEKSPEQLVGTLVG